MAALSAAPLWEQQRRFFITEGPRVWRDSIVPSYVSTNPFLGDFLAQVLAAYITEVGAPGGPIDVIELGGGSGRLAFHVLRSLRRRLGPEPCPAFRYVLSDLAPSMLDYWRQHPRLRPFVEAGVLDFAEFDISRPAQLHLTESGDILLEGPADRPAAVVASYCFDSVPQDLFAVDGAGHLSEYLVRSCGGVEWPESAELSFEDRPCPDAKPRYDDPELEDVLSGYRHLGRPAMVPFPNTAISSLAYLADRYPHGLLALIGDRGFTHPDQAEMLSAIEPTRHGSVSLPVNFHAIGQWFLGRGGAAWHPDHVARSFNVSAFALSPDRPLPKTATAYRVATATGDPDTFFTVKKAVQAQYSSLGVPEAIAFLRLSHWDADIFDAMFLHLLDRLGDDPPDEVGLAELVATVDHVWDGFYAITDGDLAFMAGSVLYAGGAYREALGYFDRSLVASGATVDAWLNSAVCHHMVGARDQALACVGRALELAPGLDQAVTLLQELLA